MSGKIYAPIKTTTITGDPNDSSNYYRDVTGETVNTTKFGMHTVILNPADIGGGNPLGAYITDYFDDDEASNNRYFVGKQKTDGTWLIQLVTLTDTGKDLATTYANISNNSGEATLASAWSNRATLTYADITTLTGV